MARGNSKETTVFKGEPSGAQLRVDVSSIYDKHVNSEAYPRWLPKGPRYHSFNFSEELKKISKQKVEKGQKVHLEKNNSSPLFPNPVV